MDILQNLSVEPKYKEMFQITVSAITPEFTVQ